jgi:hypothetical protein
MKPSRRDDPILLTRFSGNSPESELKINFIQTQIKNFEVDRLFLILKLELHLHPNHEVH